MARGRRGVSDVDNAVYPRMALCYSSVSKHWPTGPTTFRRREGFSRIFDMRIVANPLGFGSITTGSKIDRVAALPFDAPSTLDFFSRGVRVGLFVLHDRPSQRPDATLDKSGARRATGGYWSRLWVSDADVTHLVALLMQAPSWRLRSVLAACGYSCGPNDDDRLRTQIAQAVARGRLGLFIAPRERYRAGASAALPPPVAESASTAQDDIAISAPDKRPTWQTSPLLLNAGTDSVIATVTTASAPPLQKYWIEIELIGEDGLPIPDLAYRLTTADGDLREGRLNADGWARIDDLQSDAGCKICFPSLDQDAWEAVEALPARVA